MSRNSTPSPYREVGMRANAYARRPAKLPTLSVTKKDRDAVRTWHKWDYQTSGKFGLWCRNCGKPKFAVEMKPCQNLSRKDGTLVGSTVSGSERAMAALSAPRRGK